MQKPVAREVLSPRALSRALLARQYLLERAEVTPADAIRNLVGMQAQVPTDPYFGLWSRLKDFQPQDLSDLIETRKAVRIAVMRGTLHLVAAEDALEMRALVQPTISRLLTGTPFGRETKGMNLAAVMKTARAAVEKTPITLAGLREIIAAKHRDVPAHSASYVFHYTAPLVQVPPRGLWGKSGAAKITTAEAWLGKPAVKKPSVEKIVLRYLAAFGPASVMDAQAWSGLSKLTPVFEKLRPKLLTFADEGGRELFDLPDAPRPDPETPAPPRFLPVYDNATLGFANRDRILQFKPKKPPTENAWMKSFLVDGFVAGFWKIVEERKVVRLELEPFRVFSKKEKLALSVEGIRLLKFAAPKATDFAVDVGVY